MEQLAPYQVYIQEVCPRGWTIHHTEHALCLRCAWLSFNPIHIHFPRLLGVNSGALRPTSARARGPKGHRVTSAGPSCESSGWLGCGDDSVSAASPPPPRENCVAALCSPMPPMSEHMHPFLFFLSIPSPFHPVSSDPTAHPLFLSLPAAAPSTAAPEHHTPPPLLTIHPRTEPLLRPPLLRRARCTLRRPPLLVVFGCVSHLRGPWLLFLRPASRDSAQRVLRRQERRKAKTQKSLPKKRPKESMKQSLP